MADFLGEGSVDSALGGVTATQYLPGQALSGLEPAESESGLSSSESVLNILKLIFAGAPLSEVLTIIARLVEARGKGMLCTIYLLDKDGRHLRCATAPSLPAQYIAQLDGTPVGPKGCNCGTAVYRREPVYVTDNRISLAKASSLPTPVARPRIEAMDTTGTRLRRTSISGNACKPVGPGGIFADSSSGARKS